MKPWQIILIVILILIVIGLLIYRAAIRSKQAATKMTSSSIQTTQTSQDQGKISAAEKQQIDAWITANGLNQFGDPADTIYAGGTPLFNEMTGQQIDKYDYILSRHSDRPWKR